MQKNQVMTIMLREKEQRTFRTIQNSLKAKVLERNFPAKISNQSVTCIHLWGITLFRELSGNFRLVQIQEARLLRVVKHIGSQLSIVVSVFYSKSKEKEIVLFSPENL